MQVQSSSTRRVSHEPVAKQVSALNMYSEPPTERLSVTEFEEFAFDRLRREPCRAPTGPCYPQVPHETR